MLPRSRSASRSSRTALGCGISSSSLSRRYSFGGRQVHDENIVATMPAHGERRLLTFNDVDFRRFTALMEIVTP